MNLNNSYRINKKFNHIPTLIWFTGLSGAGKSTLALAIEKKLKDIGINTFVLDGDIVRNGISADLGFSEEDRRENIRRIVEISKLSINAGITTLVSVISPFLEDRKKARDLVGGGVVNFISRSIINLYPLKRFVLKVVSKYVIKYIFLLKKKSKAY